ncbi:MAG: MFS transporter [Candidatus Latescibacteria bacterium]|nr:MFS transporter [Candidatus Latescibacterota bacterium]
MPPSPNSSAKKPLFYGWWIVLASFFVQILQGALLFHGFGTYILPLQSEFGWKRAEIAGVFSMVRAESGLLGPLQGWLIGRYGPRQVMRVGFVLFGIGFWQFSRVDSLIQLYLAFALIALGASLAGFMSIASTIANWFVRRRSTALGLMLAGMGLGGTLVPLLVYAMATVGWRATAQISAVAVVLLGLPLAQIMRRSPEDHGYLPDGDSAPLDKGEEPQEEPAFSVRQALRTPAFWLLSLGHASALLAVGTVLAHQIPHMVEGLGMSQKEAGLNVALLVWVTMMGQLSGGYLGDRVNKRLVMFACMWLHVAGLLVFALVDSVWGARIFAVLHGTAWGVRGTLINAIRADYFGRASYAAISGYASLIIMMGMTLGPLFAGFLRDWLGNYQLAFIVLAGLVGLGSGAFLAARKPVPPAKASNPAS